MPDLKTTRPMSSRFVQIILAWALFGYPLTVGISELLELPNSPVSISMRALILAVALFLILFKAKAKSRIVLFAFVIFWFAYLARLSYSLILVGEWSPLDPIEYWVWSIGVCLVPSLALMLSFKPDAGAYSKTAQVIGFIAALALALVYGSTSAVDDLGRAVAYNRLNLETLNPIVIGHLGASGILFSIALFVSGFQSRRQTVLAGLCIILGAIALALANSRGPLVALLVALAVLVFARARERRTWALGFVLMLAGVLVIPFSTDILSDGGLADRVARVFEGGDRSVRRRDELYAAAFAQFAASPYFGDGVFVRSFQSYPHNVILEAFMTTGLIGGAAFVTIIVLALKYAWRMLKMDPKLSWLALIAIQLIVAAQFSGALYSSGSMWMLVGIMLAYGSQTTKTNRARLQRRRPQRRITEGTLGASGQPIAFGEVGREA